MGDGLGQRPNRFHVPDAASQLALARDGDERGTGRSEQWIIWKHTCRLDATDAIPNGLPSNVQENGPLLLAEEGLHATHVTTPRDCPLWRYGRLGRRP